MQRIVALVAACLFCSNALAQSQPCSFSESTARDGNGVVSLPWRLDFPSSAGSDPHPWASIDFGVQWREYLVSILSTIRSSGLRIEHDRIAMNPGHRWWISPWMDYGPAGREALNGLTKERTPRPDDLAQGSPAGGQLWAIGWYNADGAQVLGKIFSNPCDPDIADAISFPSGTAAVKLLFIDLGPTAVPYLNESPSIVAMIDPAGGNGDPAKREPHTLRLLQVDVATRDDRASQTGWVFGTFVWKGPRKGDGLFDNLVPVGLLWGNDPGESGTAIKQSIVNAELDGLLYDRTGRLWMGFNGRMNGPADNKYSACTSCHGAAQWPRSSRFGMVVSADVGTTPEEIKKHVDTYFRNIRGGELFDEQEQGAKPLDYSLQLEAAFFRMCTACQTGALVGQTPHLCTLNKRFSGLGPSCNQKPVASASAPLPAALFDEPLPRQ